MVIGDNYFTIPVFTDLSATTIYFVAFCFLMFMLSVPFRYLIRPYVLLVANIFFIYTFGLNNLIYLFGFAVLGYAFSFIVRKYRGNRAVLLLALPFAAGLFYFKYNAQVSSVIIPLGISFYTFKILSYLFDIYAGRIEPEKNPVFYLDYVTFFPCITAGPINRAEPFLKELKSRREFEYSDAGSGFMLIALGLFEKRVFCDFVASVVERSLDNPEMLGYNVLFGVLLYALQIYLDFDAYSNIAIGAARVMGFRLERNFSSPYIARNLKEFWAGWHISLTSWFKDYLYIPLGGSRKGTLRKYFNIIFIFFVSALWHGVSLTFIIWGLGHGLIRVIEDIVSSLFKKIKISKYIIYIFSPVFVVINFLIVSALWVFFRSPDLASAVAVFEKIAAGGAFSYELMGLTHNEFIWTLVIAGTMTVTDIIRKLLPIGDILGKEVFIVRWAIYAVLIIGFLIFGMYGGSFDANDFIYRRF